MPRSFVIRLIVVLVVIAVALVVLSRLDSAKVPHPVIKVVPDNALAH